MSDKKKAFETPTVKSKVNSKRLPTASVFATSRKLPPSQGLLKSPGQDRFVAPLPRPKINKNATVLCDADSTMMRTDAACSGMPDFDSVYRQVAYGKFLRAQLEECLTEEKIEREETELDSQMGMLANRFQNTVDQLEKTSQRLKDISFSVEQKRMIDLKSNDSAQFYKLTDNSNAADLLNNLSIAEKSRLNNLETKNVDFGYSKESGHKHLLDAVNEAIGGLEQIKKQSNLDMPKFKEYQDTERNLNEVEKDRVDLESLRSDFEKKFPKYSEQLIRQVSERINEVMQDTETVEGDDNDNNNDDSD